MTNPVHTDSDLAYIYTEKVKKNLNLGSEGERVQLGGSSVYCRQHQSSDFVIEDRRRRSIHNKI